MQRRERHMTDMDYKALKKGLGLQVRVLSNSTV
jgi:hypothetical protein